MVASYCYLMDRLISLAITPGYNSPTCSNERSALYEPLRNNVILSSFLSELGKEFNRYFFSVGDELLQSSQTDRLLVALEHLCPGFGRRKWVKTTSCCRRKIESGSKTNFSL